MIPKEFYDLFKMSNSFSKELWFVEKKLVQKLSFTILSQSLNTHVIVKEFSSLLAVASSARNSYAHFKMPDYEFCGFTFLS